MTAPTVPVVDHLRDNSSKPNDGCYSVAALANRWGLGVEKIRGFIRSGELQALNLAQTRCGKPQYRITPEAVTAFERGRAAVTVTKTVRRRRSKQGKDYYPD